MGLDGTRRDETRRDETRRDGTRRDETGRDGTRRDETGRDGTRRDETRRDGTGRDGTGRDGTGRDGTGQDGTRRDETRRDGTRSDKTQWNDTTENGMEIEIHTETEKETGQRRRRRRRRNSTTKYGAAVSESGCGCVGCVCATSGGAVALERRTLHLGRSTTMATTAAATAAVAGPECACVSEIPGPRFTVLLRRGVGMGVGIRATLWRPSVGYRVWCESMSMLPVTGRAALKSGGRAAVWSVKETGNMTGCTHRVTEYRYVGKRERCGSLNELQCRATLTARYAITRRRQRESQRHNGRCHGNSA